MFTPFKGEHTLMELPSLLSSPVIWAENQLKVN